MSVEPVKIARHWKVLVRGGRVRNISHKCVDVIDVRLGQPRRVKVANDGCGEHKVTIVKVVIVVEGIAEIGSIVTSGVSRRRDNTSPCTWTLLAPACVMRIFTTYFRSIEGKSADWLRIY